MTRHLTDRGGATNAPPEQALPNSKAAGAEVTARRQGRQRADRTAQAFAQPPLSRHPVTLIAKSRSAGRRPGVGLRARSDHVERRHGATTVTYG